MAHLPRLVPETGDVSYVDDDGLTHANDTVMHYRDSSGNMQEVGPAYPLPTKDFRSSVAAGKVPGWTIMNAMGEWEDGSVDAAGEDCCRWDDISGPARLTTPSDAGVQMSVVSDNTNDKAANNGVASLRIEYIDVNGAEQTEDITTNGTTVVNTVATDIIFVNDMYTLTVGGNGVARGNIGIYLFGGSIAADLYQMIAKGGNKSLVPHRMVPANKTLLLQTWHTEVSTNDRCAMKIRSTDMNGVLIPGVFCFKDVAYVSKAVSGELDLRGTAIPATSIVKVSHWDDQAGSDGSCGWWGYLVENAYL